MYTLNIGAIQHICQDRCQGLNRNFFFSILTSHCRCQGNFLSLFFLIILISIRTKQFPCLKISRENRKRKPQIRELYPINKLYSPTWKIVNIKLKRNPIQWQDENVALHNWLDHISSQNPLHHQCKAWNRLATVDMKKLPTKGWQSTQYLIATTVLHCAKVEIL